MHLFIVNVYNTIQLQMDLEMQRRTCEFLRFEPVNNRMEIHKKEPGVSQYYEYECQSIKASMMTVIQLIQIECRTRERLFD